MFLSLYGLLIVQFYQKAYALTNTQIQLRPLLRHSFGCWQQIKIFRLAPTTGRRSGRGRGQTGTWTEPGPGTGTGTERPETRWQLYLAPLPAHGSSSARGDNKPQCSGQKLGSIFTFFVHDRVVTVPAFLLDSPPHPQSWHLMCEFVI